MTRRDAWGYDLPDDDIEAERADVARLLGYGDHDDLPPLPEHCPTHGPYLPLSLVNPECHQCVADQEWQRTRDDTRHLY